MGENSLGRVFLTRMGSNPRSQDRQNAASLLQGDMTKTRAALPRFTSMRVASSAGTGTGPRRRRTPRMADFRPDRDPLARLFPSMSHRDRAAAWMYIAAVLMCYVAFLAWGCFCHDAERGTGFSFNRDCIGGFPVPGVPWCVVISGGVTLHALVTLPFLYFLYRYYSCYAAARSLLQGGALCGAQYATLTVGVGKSDPPPGFGTSGVPLGAAITAGLGAWLLLSAAGARGFWYNAVLGATMKYAVAYVVLSVAGGTVVAFRLHLALGIGIASALLVVVVWSMQVFVGENSRKRAVLAWLTPWVLAAAIASPIELLGFGLPQYYGCGVGLTAILCFCGCLSYAYEHHGALQAFNLAILMLVQIIVIVSAFGVGYYMHPAAGLFVAFCFEAMSFSTFLVGRQEGLQFGAIAAVYPALILSCYTLLLKLAYLQTWPYSISMGCGSALVCSILVSLFVWRRGVISGIRIGFIFLLSLVQVNLVLIEVLVLTFPRVPSVLFGGFNCALLLCALLYGLSVDDGSGRLYGSGVEVFLFVIFGQAFSYGVTFTMFALYGAADINAHISGTVLGVVTIGAPSVCRALSGSSNGGRNFRRGVVRALFSNRGPGRAILRPLPTHALRCCRCLPCSWSCSGCCSSSCCASGATWTPRPPCSSRRPTRRCCFCSWASRFGASSWPLDWSTSCS